MTSRKSERRIAICTSCGSAYAAEVWSDGEIQPIGKRTGCDCGSENFEVAEDLDSDSLEDGNIG